MPLLALCLLVCVIAAFLAASLGLLRVGKSRISRAAEPDTYHEVRLRSVLDHPLVWEYVGSGRYLQAAFSRAAAQSYATKFDTITSKKLSSLAAKSASLTFSAWTKDIGCDWTKDVFMSAIEGGSISCMDFVLYSNDSPVLDRSDVDIMMSAVQGGRVDVIAWLHERGFEWFDGICSVAAMHGRLEAVIWLLDHGCSSTRVCVAAAAHGHLDILKWMHANNHHIERGASGGAARGGHIHILEWIQEMGIPLDALACNCAAMENRLDILQWLRVHGWPWNAGAITIARLNGYTALEEWALANGCPVPI